MFDLAIGAGYGAGGGGDLNLLAPEHGCCVQSDGLIADGPDAMAKAVRHETKYGADWIKIMVTGTYAGWLDEIRPACDLHGR